jgi:hypothetical protein
MHVHTYRDESHCRHFDLISEGKRPRTIDLVSAVMSGMLVMGFACALNACSRAGARSATQGASAGPV